MSVKIEDGISISIRGLERHLNQREIDALLESLALLEKTAILTRTAEGEDADSIKFKPYSEKYKKYREKKGRPVSKPDLNFTGRMLGSMRTNVARHQGQVFFGRKEESQKAAAHSLGLKNLKKAKRNFFALSFNDIRDLNTEVQNWFDELIKNAG